MLSKTSVVDLVTKNDHAGTYELVLVVDGPDWLLADCHPLLQDKLNNYLCYIIDGQMQKEYPDASVDRVEILIQSDHTPPQPTATFIARLITAAENHGVRVRYSPL